MDVCHLSQNSSDRSNSFSTLILNKLLFPLISLKDPNKSNTQKYFRHSNIKRYELALLRSGYFIYFGRLDITFTEILQHTFEPKPFVTSDPSN